MDLYEKLTEDPYFFKWVYNSNPETETYWEQYIVDHPEDSETLYTLKSMLRNIRYSVDFMSAAEKHEISEAVVRELRLKDKRSHLRRIMVAVLKNAAIMLLIAGLGLTAILFWLKNDKTDDEQVSLELNLENIQEPLLKMAEGRQVELKDKNSTLDYTKEGHIVVNRDSMILSDNIKGKPDINELIIPYGNRSVVTLCDSTVVTLNAGSKLVFPSFFTGKTREVTLIGEAYFIVSRNREMPFVVKAGSLDIKVMGTEFNVTAYPDESIIQTVLKEGSVSVRKNTGGIFERELYLKPSQMAVYDKKEEATSVTEVDVETYTIWKQGILRFEQTDLSRILKKVERYYNIRITYRDPLDGIIKISGKLDLARDKAEVFEYLAKVSGNSFEKLDEGNYVIR